MLGLLDGNESPVEAEIKLRAFGEHQAWSLELPRHGHVSASKAEESSETKRFSITRKSAESFGSVVAAIAKDYIDSYPGLDNSGSNTGITTWSR